MQDQVTKSFFLTVSAGKRLIGRAIAEMDEIVDVMMNRTLVIIAGTTNSYVAEEVLKKIGHKDVLNKKVFIRGVTLPPHYIMNESGQLDGASSFPGDVVIRKGEWLQGKTIHDVIDELKRGDIIMKGANAANFQRKQAGIIIGDSKGGTILLSLQAIIGRRVSLYIPVSQEKRVYEDLNRIAATINASDAQGHRYCVVSGNLVSELESIESLTGVSAKLAGAGGVCGAEGGIWVTLTGNRASVNQAYSLLDSLSAEPPFEL